MGKSSTGLDENVAAFISYVLGFITGIYFLAVEKKSKFVRFHAFQSTFFSIGALVITFVFGLIPLLGWVLSVLLQIVFLVTWIYCLVMSIQGKKFKLPIVGDMAEKYSK